MDLGGVYDAKCHSAAEIPATVVIPQVFGNTPVAVYSVIGTLAPGDRGWVSFVSGDSAYPVWLGKANPDYLNIT